LPLRAQCAHMPPRMLSMAVRGGVCGKARTTGGSRRRMRRPTLWRLVSEAVHAACARTPAPGRSGQRKCTLLKLNREAVFTARAEPAAEVPARGTARNGAHARYRGCSSCAYHENDRPPGHTHTHTHACASRKRDEKGGAAAVRTHIDATKGES
jgi:hypothetical protein